LLIDRHAIERELHDVVERHDLRRECAREQIAIGAPRHAHTHVAVRIENAVLRERPVCDNEIKRLIHFGCVSPPAQPTLSAARVHGSYGFSDIRI
jgi:hypothetical protein